MLLATGRPDRTGAMGCVLGGGLGVAGMLGGLALGAAPLMALVPKST